MLILVNLCVDLCMGVVALIWTIRTHTVGTPVQGNLSCCCCEKEGGKLLLLATQKKNTDRCCLCCVQLMCCERWGCHHLDWSGCCSRLTTPNGAVCQAHSSPPAAEPL